MDFRNPMPNNIPHSMRPEPLQITGDLALAMAYVVVQPPIAQVYYPEAALKQGTLFPQLDKPFLGSRGSY